MEGLPNISEEVSKVMKYYVEHIKTLYPETCEGQLHKDAEKFVRAWVELQIDNGLTKYYCQEQS